MPLSMGYESYRVSGTAEAANIAMQHELHERRISNLGLPTKLKWRNALKLMEADRGAVSA